MLQLACIGILFANRRLRIRSGGRPGEGEGEGEGEGKGEVKMERQRGRDERDRHALCESHTWRDSAKPCRYITKEERDALKMRFFRSKLSMVSPLSHPPPRVPSPLLLSPYLGFFISHSTLRLPFPSVHCPPLITPNLTVSTQHLP
eukprot:3385523-Rhodomonas_salina.1